MKRKACILILIISVMGCKKPYTPAIVAANNNYLVVEGAINAGSDSTIIKVSRTIKLSSKVTDNPVLGAVLTVESDQNTIYPLTETTDGKYISPGLNLDGSHKYRLRIKINSGQYLSDYVAVLNSPPIDSVSYDIKGTVSGPGVNIYVSTHDNSNKVFYYRWEYKETWMFHSNFPSYFYSNGDTVLGRNMITNNITDCWANNSSSTIVLGSSAKLSRDVIFNNSVISIASTSEKIGDKYSILVKQYALSLEAYSFYTNLKKNTEQLGSIFDALPSEIEGNIHSVNNPSEPVIGYITVGSTTSQRIFVDKRLLPDWATTPFYTNCVLAFPGGPCCYYPDQVDQNINYLTNNNPDPLIPIDAIGRPGQPPIGYTASTRACVDCTLRGTNKQPSFWQ